MREIKEQAKLELALIENLQRRDLNILEEAAAYQKLIDEFNLAHEEIAKQVGKSRPVISNALRLLKLPIEIQLGIRNGDISMGHARALINIENPEKQLEIFNQIILNNLSVREAEDLARGVKTIVESVKTSSGNKTTKSSLSVEQQILVDDLRAVFNTKVSINREVNGKGKIVIPFKSDNDLKRILDLLDI